MWLAVQLPDGMFGVWHWELANGSRIYTDGCFAPADGGEPIPVVDFRHDLDWIDADGGAVSYARDGAEVAGIAGRVELTLDGGREVGARGRGPVGAALRGPRRRSQPGPRHDG